MRTSLFDFKLPDELIATNPASPRDSARMLVVDEAIADSHVISLPDYLKPGDIMVFNDTRVIPARLIGKRGEATVEILLHKIVSSSPLEGEDRGGGIMNTHLHSSHITPHPNPLPQGERELWRCFAKPAKKLKPDDRIIFADDFAATVIEKQADGQIIIAFSSPLEGEDQGGGWFHAQLEKYGQMPLPPYIQKQRTVIARNEMTKQSSDGSPRYARDDENYQTVYAKHEGSVAAPTAGLHFTPELLAAIEAKGIKTAHVTLHVGGGTFLPVKVEDTSEHVMHSEYAEISRDTADRINTAKAAGGRVIAVGTTSLRTLESATTEDGVVQPMAAETDIFITPGYRFKCVDVLMTNFHLPKSTLFMLVSAFSGLETMQKAYAHAISARYRFYSYGDACLLFNSSHSGEDGNKYL